MPEGTKQLYVVSADLEAVTNRWGKSEGIITPQPEYYELHHSVLADELAKATDCEIEIVSADDISKGMHQKLKGTHLPIISLDRAYITDDDNASHIEFTRAVTEDFSPILGYRGLGLSPRPGALDIASQIGALSAKSREPVCLVDDVLFSGAGLKAVAEMLEEVNRPVEKVIVGIGVGSGINLLRTLGVEIDCVKEYDEVYDEVCERDFILGAPLSGRTVLKDGGTWWSAPYLEPFGSTSWASIPEDKSEQFSKVCTDLSYRYWKEIERLNGFTIPGDKIPRPVRALQKAPSITKALQEILLETV
ncbi:MAG: hypothetical protein QFB86_01240 [Patescibacteria group bacterium]|nr:hypothetical protein [Patescibacteria group bacterium]